MVHPHPAHPLPPWALHRENSVLLILPSLSVRKALSWWGVGGWFLTQSASSEGFIFWNEPQPQKEAETASAMAAIYPNTNDTGVAKPFQRAAVTKCSIWQLPYMCMSKLASDFLFFIFSLYHTPLEMLHLVRNRVNDAHEPGEGPLLTSVGVISDTRQ